MIVLKGEYYYCVELDQDLDETQLARLEHLLQAQRCEFEAHPTGVWVVPRLGTISPWCSKATNILHVCGLTAVRRVERARHYTEASAATHDRMTESLVSEFSDLLKLFDVRPPKPLVEINLLSEGREALIQANETLGFGIRS